MGSVVKISRRRPIDPPVRRIRSPEQREAEDWRSLIVLATVFSATAVAMAIAVVVAGSSNWAEAIPLIACVVVIALTKVVLADAVFFIMIRSDTHAEAKAMAAAADARAAGLVIRRAPPPPRRHLIKMRLIKMRQIKAAGSRPRQPRQGAIRLAPPARKPGGTAPRPDDR
ncbi:MAG: hypothetical protein IVW54_10005 [Candidatus Binataceae bacterium]|nr:hypothetical protein [Candidatus Binataceae bacterium]